MPALLGPLVQTALDVTRPADLQPDVTVGAVDVVVPRGADSVAGTTAVAGRRIEERGRDVDWRGSSPRRGGRRHPEHVDEAGFVGFGDGFRELAEQLGGCLRGQCGWDPSEEILGL